LIHRGEGGEIMLVLILLATWIATWIGVALILRRKGFATGFGLSGGFVVSCGVLALVSLILTDQAKVAEQTKVAQQPQLTAPKPDRQRFQKKARDDRGKVTARQYEDQWSFPVASSEPECLDTAAVIINTPSGTYLFNGTGMDRYGNTYKSSRDVGIPVPGLGTEAQAKLPPPHVLMQYGFKLCD
jgi:hypothetical protein